ncbi:pimeloyl-ACP methyl ester carboxylesterase [Povalibacter uvarum]|uniref:Pimeloyl-ACP methyl ester carboxylesterase n=1 Tax=Povalibacter uvarum TaxID=732238 RepID=A0A841HGV1_9GAMM|nr:alpha/beta fold hydrolase [Povalibacter uvarum]MBB6091659.1 pimeloyl-ACP methyl ester carboxylesterase [Povalibacter uvarum]
MLAVAAFALGAAGCGKAERCASGRPVLFVHGSGLDSSTWKPMRGAFESAGYPSSWLVAVDLKPSDGSSIAAAEQTIEPAARRLLDAAQATAKEAGCSPPEKIDIIAHSMGSMSARWYIAKRRADLVRNLVGIAPANHGSDALCGLSGEGNRELCPAFAQDATSHRLQVELNGTRDQPADETPFGRGTDRPGVASLPPDEMRHVQYTTFRLGTDEWLRPETSAVLDGAGGLQLHELAGNGTETTPGNVLWQREVRHDDLPTDPALIVTVIASLQRDIAP